MCGLKRIGSLFWALWTLLSDLFAVKGTLLQTESSMTTVHYTKGLKASARQVLTKNISHFADLLIKFFGQLALYEWLHATDVAKVYFDVDGKASETTADQLLADAHAGVRKFMGMPPDAPLPRIKTLYSHGGPKLSYRLVLPDYRMKIADQKKRIVRLGLDKNRPFDAAPNGTNQKLRTVGSYKTEEDRRVMDLQREGPLTDQDLIDTIVQHVTDDMELLTEPDCTLPQVEAPLPATAATAAKASIPKPAQPGSKRVKRADTVAPSDTTSTSIVPSAPRQQSAKSSTSSQFRVPRDKDNALALLRANGFLAPHFVGLPRDSSLTFNADNRSDCPCCHQDHDRQHWYLSEDGQGYLHARSYSDRCRTLRLQAPLLDPTAIKQRLQALEEDRQRLQEVCTRMDAADCDIASIWRRLKQDVVDCAPGIEDNLKQTLDCYTLVPKKAGGFDFRCIDDGLTTYTCSILLRPTCSVTSSDPRAHPVIVNWSDNHILERLVSNPNHADVCYAQWFLAEELRAGRQWAFDADHLYSHEGGLWVRLTEETQLRQRFQEMACGALRKVVAIVDGAPDDVDGIDVKGKKKGLRAALAHVECASAATTVMRSIKDTVYRKDFAAKLDTDRDLLGTPDGVLDLPTGKLLTGVSPVTKSAKPSWRGLDFPTPDVATFFGTIFDNDQDLVEYMRCVLGAALTGERLEAYLCWTGVGSNGKGCLHEWLRVTLGDYYCTASPHIFFGEKTNRGGATPELAALDRMRLAVVDESSDTDMLNTAQVKRLTGSDVLPVRNLYQIHFWDMAVTHTQVLLTQHLPKIDVEDEAMRRRIIVVPFKLRFKSEEDFDAQDPTHRHKDPALGTFLQSEPVMEQLLV